MSNLPMHVALVSEIGSDRLSFSELAVVSAAISKQVSRDFGPIWGVNATVDPFPSLNDVPPGSWPVIIKDDIDQPGAAGFHTDQNGNPLALVQFGPGWSLTASHETLEMLADPSGNRVVSSLAPEDSGSTARVEILVEVCDPSEDASFSYTIDGVTVSDFYTPRFLDLVTAPGVRYGFSSALTKSRQVLDGGYISYHDLADDQWKQLLNSGGAFSVRVLGTLSASNGRTIRSQIDEIVARHKAIDSGKSKHQARFNAALEHSTTLRKSVSAGATSKAEMWRAQCARLAAPKA